MSTKRVTVLGTGLMGAGMARSLARAGLDVGVWNRSADRARPLAADGITVHEDPVAAVANADVVVTMLFDADAVTEVMTRALPAMRRDALWMQTSTVGLDATARLAELASQYGVGFLDSPVLGTIPQVREGKLVALIGGLPESLARARPLLEKLTRRIEHMGPNGSGYAMKLAVNLGLGAYIEALSESLALGMRQGLSLDQMLEVLQEAPYASGWMKSKIGVLKGEKPAMTLDIRTLRKDIMSAVATGALSGVPMPLAAGTLTMLSAAVANGHGSGDLGELAKFLRESMVQDFG